MIPAEIRQAVLALQEQSRGVRDIARCLRVSRNTVRRVLRAPEPPAPAPSAQQAECAEHLAALYPRCKGNAVRIQELLKEEHAIEVPYSTLTRLIREQALRAPPRRSGIYTFGPGAELRHDTSPHRLELGGKQLTAQCASLILAYSRLLFFQYYPAFTRFEAKAFLSEALRFFEGSCPRCTIDNTSVILAGGSGPEALIAPEMEAFGALFGMRFIPHAIGHSDRNAKQESFWATLEGHLMAQLEGINDLRLGPLNALTQAWLEQEYHRSVHKELATTPLRRYLQERSVGRPAPSSETLRRLPDLTLGALTHPSSNLADFYREMGDLFGVELRPHNRWGGFKALRARWLAHPDGSLLRPVLLIDEAQEMPPAVLNAELLT